MFNDKFYSKFVLGINITNPLTNQAMRLILPFLTYFLISTSFSVYAQKAGVLESLDEKLTQLPSVVSVEKWEAEKPFQANYKIVIEQPIDHNKPDGATFNQRIYLSHNDFATPMVMITEGYAASNHYTSELAEMLDANQLIVEHRYFGESAPEEMDWQYLTTRQAADDHHHIVELFKQIYTGKWINTGISKGGQTTLYHRYYYPEDVDISIPYVAPLNFEIEDPRIYKFLNSVGDAACRKKIFEFQRRLLERREEILPFMKWYCFGKGQNFAIGRETAYEYAVLEYSFAFWQWGSNCENIPGKNATVDEMLEHLIDVVGFSLYSEKGVAYYAPFFYQAMTELGYYGFDTTGLRHLLKYATEPTNTIFAPKLGLPFDASLNQKVNQWIRKSGNRIIYVYGELDTWSATAVSPSRKTDSMRIIMKGKAHHDARISNMTAQNKEKVMAALNRWLNE